MNLLTNQHNDGPMTSKRRMSPDPRRAHGRFPRQAGALATMAAVAMLAAACGSGNPSSSAGSTSTSSPSYRADLAFAQCIRAHGLTGFPNPSPSQGSGYGGQLNGPPSSPAARAVAACEHLLASGNTGTGLTKVPTTPSPTGPGAVAADCLTLSTPCFTPKQLRVAYGVQPLLDRGVTGRGETVVLPEFPPSATGPSSVVSSVEVPTSSDIRLDLAQFDRMFGLPAAQLQVVNSLAHAASPWQASIEEVEDTEIVHAVAPDADIREVLIPSADTVSSGAVSAAVVAALQLGLSQGSVISLSAGAGEQCFTPAEVAQVGSVLQAAEGDRVTVVVSTGDSGAATTACPPEAGSSTVKGVDLPASDPLALAVGGTSLVANRKTGAYISETVWNIPPSAGGPKAGGGGFSQPFPRPTYQLGIAGIGATRGVPDVSGDADPRTGMALTIADGGEHSVVIGAGGASAAAPLWAGVIALANQYAGRNLGFINPALYRIGLSAHYHQAFHDVTAGNNTVVLPTETISGYQAAPGWDPVTGWGSPNAQALVPLLARYVSP